MTETCAKCGHPITAHQAAVDRRPGPCAVCGCGVIFGPDDAVHHPAHYTQHPSGVECITITEHMSFCIGNAIKYLWRADLKNGIEDLEKAAWYVEREIQRRKGTA